MTNVHQIADRKLFQKIRSKKKLIQVLFNFITHFHYNNSSKSPQPMSNPIQENQKTLINMYSVHLFYKEVLDEIQQTLLSEKKERYMLSAWDDHKSKLFVHAVRHYLNNQPTLFNRALQKYSNNQVQSIIPLKRKKRKNSTISGVQSVKALSHKSKSSKKESTVGMSKQSDIKNSAKNFIQKQLSNSQKFSEAICNTSSKQKLEKLEPTAIDPMKKPQLEFHKLEYQQDQSVNDLLHFQNYRNEMSFTKEEDRKSVKSSVKEESIFYQDQDKRNGQEDEESSDEQSLGKFVERAQQKTNALIFGNFLTRQLRHKAKQDKIDLELNNCFVKMFKYGRDAFYTRMTLNLFKQEIHDIGKPPK